MKLSNSERYVMEVFWRSKEPISATDVVLQNLHRSWSDSYVFLMINSLRQKGAIKFYDIFDKGKSVVRRYVPVMTKAEYLTELMTAQAEYSDDDIFEVLKLLISEIDDEEALEYISYEAIARCHSLTDKKRR